MKPLQKRYQYLQHFRNAIQKQKTYPIGTLAYYGPDDQTITKVIAGVLPNESTNPILKKWQGDGIAEDASIAAEIGEFFQEHAAQNIVMTEGIIGCPHEEGIDYPEGEVCPECPFWAEE
jgi:hypothetical protein